MMRVVEASGQVLDTFLAAFEAARAGASAQAEEVVRPILEAVRTEGDEALCRYARALDQAPLAPERLRVSSEELGAALTSLDRAVREALEFAASRIEAFHRREVAPGWTAEDAVGVIGQVILPLEAVGIYIPGGKAAYPSTVLMNAIPARIAGVERRVLATPVGPDLQVPPVVLAAARIAGVEEIYRVGGAQAVGAMAYGTASVPRVDKIVGPGNLYVATAKRLVAGVVGTDMIAGPTEIVVVADGGADPATVAADLLAQAEHDEAASAILITTDRVLAEGTQAALEEQLADLPRRAIAAASLAKHGAILVVPDLDAAFAVANRIAPEHLEVQVEDPWKWLSAVRHAGAIFLGPYSGEVFGDYVAGPSHVLPTGGTARFASPLSVHDFQKRSSVICLSQEGAQALGQAAARLGRVEGLEGHARAAERRFKG